MRWIALLTAFAFASCGGNGETDDDGDEDAGPTDAGPGEPRCEAFQNEGPKQVSLPEGGDAVWPVIAAVGDHVYVAWYTEEDEKDPGSVQRAWLAELDETGTRVSDPVELGDGGKRPSLGVNGGQMAVVWREVGIDLKDLHVDLVDPGPIVTPTTTLPNAEPETSAHIVGAAGGDGYGVALTVDPSDLAFVRLDAAGATADPEPEPIVVATVWVKPRLAPTADGFLVFHLLGSALRVLAVDDAGVAQGKPGLLGNQNFVPWDEYLSSLAVAMGDGGIYVLNDDGAERNSPDHGIFLTIVAPDGTRTAAPRTVLVAGGPARNPTAVWTGEGLAVLWADGTDPTSQVSAALLDAEGDAIGGSRQLAPNSQDHEMPDAVWLGDYGIVAFSGGSRPARTISVQRFDCAP